MKWLFTGFESVAQSGKRGFGLIAVEQSTRQGPGTGKKPSRHCRALITHHSDRDAPPLYLAVLIFHLAVNSAVKHQLLALYCVHAHLTIKLLLRLPLKMPER